MAFRWFREKPLRAIWEVERGDRKAVLVGTAHFFPYSFKKAMAKLIKDADLILFEGPLDEASMLRVVQYGWQGEDSPSLIDALDPEVVKTINKLLKARLGDKRGTESYLQLLHSNHQNHFEAHMKGVRPWLAFFKIWSAFLNWPHSMDTEAFQLAHKSGKRVQSLETIEEQLVALDGIPFERIIRYVNHVEYWKAHKELFLIAFLRGELDKFSSLTGEFPTRCESVIDRRDPIFFEGIKAHLEENNPVAFVGVAHVPGILKMFSEEGYRITQKTL